MRKLVSRLIVRGVLFGLGFASSSLLFVWGNPVGAVLVGFLFIIPTVYETVVDMKNF